MCRITKKADGSNGRDYVPLSSFGYVIDQDAINKLGRLEDFEEFVGKEFDEFLKGDVLYKHCKKLEQRLQLLERENKALAQEGEEKCEKLERLEKALDKACEVLGDNSCEFDWEEKNKEEWKEWCLKDE